MVYLTIILVVFFGLLTILTIYLNYKTNLISSLELSINKCYQDFIKKYGDEIYFSKRSYHEWINKYEELKPKIIKTHEYIVALETYINKYDFIKNSLKKYVDYFLINKEYKNKIKYLVQVFNNGHNLLKKRNERFIEKEKDVFSDLFASVDGKKLTDEQKDSVIVDEASNLVIAGAGTGKTLSILGKIKYIEAKNLAKPDEVLILSYERRVREELTQKIRENFGDSYEVRTFHSFGLSVVGEITGETPDVAKVSTDAVRRQKTIEEFIRQRMDDIHFANNVNRYFSFYLTPVENKLDFSSIEEYDDYIKNRDIRSLSGDLVKSYEECEIANFLFLNQVEYEYEKEYTFPTTTETHQPYSPDFYLKDSGIWLEHIGIDRNCNTGPDVSRWDYLDSWYWKRQIHKQNMTECIETYSYQHEEGILLDSLSDMLKIRGVVFKTLPSEKVFQKLKHLGEVSLFTGLLSKFLTLFKSSRHTIQDIRKKASTSKYRKRYHAFLDVFEPIFLDYSNLLNSNKEIDFDDMINKAIEYVESGAYQSKYKYILVDEFQDISQSRYRLIKSLLNSNQESHLFCVGDDWQSIYRFAGSDLSVMTSFDKFFEYTEKMYLEETFRFNDKIADFSSSFIMKNPSQYKKKLKSRPTEEDSVFVVWYDDLNSAIEKVLKKISVENPSARVYVLGRYSQGYYRSLDSSFFTSNSYQTNLSNDFSNLDVRYSTIHGVKGSQRDYVILIGVRSGNFGLPCEIEDDPILNLVLAEEDTYQYAEERRLFYVGVTRAVKQVYILADRGKTSSFINEIFDEDSSYNVTELGDKPARAQ